MPASCRIGTCAVPVAAPCGGIRSLALTARSVSLCHRRRPGTAWSTDLPLMPHSARSTQLIEPVAGSLAGTARCGSQSTDGVQQGAGEPAQLQAGQLSRGEPGNLAELAVTGAGGTADD